MSERPFRVVIVGAGIAGLSLSHALQLADIDHVVLEKHARPVSNAGALLIVWPNTCRVFDQFGFLEKLDKLARPLTAEDNRWPDGSVLSKGGIFQEIGKRFDRDVLILDRVQVVAHLYDNLPDKSRIVTNRQVVEIQQTESGVRVISADGSVEEGDIVVGTDGVHSMVRQHIWEHANSTAPGTIPATEGEKITTEYSALFAVSKSVDGLGDAHSHITYGKGYNVITMTQPGQVLWTVIFKNENKETGPTKKRYNEDDFAKAVQKFKGIPITDSVTFDTLWATRQRVGLVPLEEGVLDHWYSGRAVLIGDSAHKMTPDLGLGANTAVEGVVTLANILHRELKANRNRGLMSRELSALFKEYQDQCIEKSKSATEFSGTTTRLNAFATPEQEHFVCHVAPSLLPNAISKFARIVSSAPKLNYVATRTINEEAPGWKLGPSKAKSRSRL